MGLHSKEGQEALSKNFDLASKNIRRMMRNGTISTSEGMQEIRRLLRVQSKAGVDAMSSSFLSAQNTIARTMSNAEGLTRKGMRAMRKLMAEQMRGFGFSEEQIQRSLRLTDAGERRDPLTGKSPETLGGHAGGGWLGMRGERGADGTAGMFDITEQPTETDYEFLGETIARKVKTAGV